MKLNKDFENTILHPYTTELWILSDNGSNWYFHISNDCRVSFNGLFFQNYFDVFSLDHQSSKKLLREWLESVLPIKIRSMARQKTNYDWILVNLFNRVKKDTDWSIRTRFGFAYNIVKKYSDIKKTNKLVYLGEYSKMI